MTCLAWHPNSQFLATGSTDFKCRVFSAVITNVDTGKPDAPGTEERCCGKVEPFGEAYCEFPSSGHTGVGWVTAVAWSPSGCTLAFACQDSTLGVATFPADGCAPAVEQYIRFGELPLTSLCFVSNLGLVGAGHDYSPAAFVDTGHGQWSFAGGLEEKPSANAKIVTSGGGGGSGSGVAYRMAMFETSSGGSSSAASSSLTSGTRDEKHDSSWKCHKGTVTALSVHGSVVTSTGMDGRLVHWDLTTVPVNVAALGVVE